MVHLGVTVHVLLVCDTCFLPCNAPHRGDSGISERAAGYLSQFAVQARALSVHPQASQRLCGSFPATAPGRGQRHRPGSHLLHGYVHKHHCINTVSVYPSRLYIYMSIRALKCSCILMLLSVPAALTLQFNTTACTMK